MASKKDLVEAHQFSRRRLVSAFLSGAPGGREVEPPRPGRTVFGGAVLAVLLIAGGAVAHFLSPQAPQDWDTHQGLVVTKGGARYVVVGSDEKHLQLRPVVNLTSAQLILGLDLEKSSEVIDQDAIAARRPKETIGISGPNVPDQLPTKDEFIKSGWTACTDNNAGTYLDISAKPQVTDLPTGGLLVKTAKSTYLIAEGQGADGTLKAYAYDLQGQMDRIGIQLFNGAAPTPITVPQAWVDVFDVGTPINFQGFGLTGVGQQYKGSDAGGTFNVGSYATYRSLHYLLTDKGWVTLDDFSYNLYTLLAEADSEPVTDVTPSIKAPPLAHAQPRTVNWPSKKPDPAGGPACAKLVTGSKVKSYATLAKPAGNNAWPSTPPSDDQTNAALVDPGKGAFVYAGTGSSASGVPFLIDSSAHANKIDGDNTVAKLGLTATSGPVIPASWLLLMPGGAALSTDLALCPPSSAKVEDNQCVAAQ